VSQNPYFVRLIQQEINVVAPQDMRVVLPDRVPNPNFKKAPSERPPNITSEQYPFSSGYLRTFIFALCS
jgi:hypothetical protein